jgi:hypothetical protein
MQIQNERERERERANYARKIVRKKMKDRYDKACNCVFMYYLLTNNY